MTCKHEFETDGGECIHCKKTFIELSMEPLETKSCKTCKYNNKSGLDRPCVYCTAVNCGWEPKEEVMEKIQLTEQQALDLLHSIYPQLWSKSEQEIIGRWKTAGYIRKTVVEEADEMYNVWCNSAAKFAYTYTVKDIIKKQHEAIQELKKKLENE
jgi:hypothetical protein